jgi:hypothetical protein
MEKYRIKTTQFAVAALRLALAIAAAAVVAGCERESDEVPAVRPYAGEYPEIGYATNAPDGRLGRFASRVESGSAELEYQAVRGYLDSVLAELEIDPSSQVLVFSRTSLQVGHILPDTPRAIYFNDDSYVAWIPNSPSLEMAGFDPQLGPILYTLQQEAAAEPVVERQMRTCLRCHDTYGLSGGGVPRFLLGSGYIGTDSELVSHEAWILTSQATPFRNRWGGWYVTGHHGDAGHLGNIVVQKAEDLQDIDSIRIGNVEELSGLFDTSAYLRPYSDIVALMVLEHQVEVQNLISRLRFEAVGRSTGVLAEELDGFVEPLVRAMLMVDAIELPAPIEGSSGFDEYFQSLGPFDSQGRSLRDLDLGKRVFRYPLSYLIYSSAFAALPEVAKDAVYRRLGEVLADTPEQDGLLRLSVSDRASIAGILADTLPDFGVP